MLFLNTKQSPDKSILHMDGDAFFVSVEMAENPSLRGRPVVTGEERGIVSALSYEAKALGITRGLPIYQLKRKYPQVLILPGNYHLYSLYSQKMFDIVRRYADDVEEYGIDECFADLSDMPTLLKMSGYEILCAIKRDIESELHITVSLGLAPTKVLAKAASKSHKPDGLTIVPREKIGSFLKHISISDIWGIGWETSCSLKKLGIVTAYDFSSKNDGWVEHYCSKPLVEIWKELNGIVVHKIHPEPKTTFASISKTKTFHPPSNNKVFLFSEFSKNTEGVCEKARRYELSARRIVIFLKTQSFRYLRSEVKLSSPLHSPALILPLIEREFEVIFRSDRQYRATGVILAELVSSRVSQQDLFGDTKRIEKFEAVNESIDALTERFGRHTVFLASSLHSLRRNGGRIPTSDISHHSSFPFFE